MRVTLTPTSGRSRTTPSEPTVGLVTCTTRLAGWPTIGVAGAMAAATSGPVNGVSWIVSERASVPPRKKICGAVTARLGGCQARTR